VKGRRRVPILVLCIYIVLASAQCPASAGAPTESGFWDLDQIYPTESAWSAEAAMIDRRLAALAAYKDRTIRSADDLASLLTLVSDARGRAGRMAKVGILQSLVDTASAEAARRRQAGEAIEAEVEREVAFVDALVRALPRKKLDRWLEESGSLAVHRRRITRILRLAPFASPKGAAGLESDLVRASQAASDLYLAALAADLDWPTLGGRTLDAGAFDELRRSADAEERRAASKAYLDFLGQNADLFARLLAHRIETDLAVARSRGLADSVDTLLVLSDGMPPGQHRALSAAATAAKPALRRAAEALRRAYALEEMTLDDLVAVQGPEAPVYAIDEAIDMTLEAASLFGKDYRDLMRERLQKPWTHWRPGPNKDSEVGVFWQVGGGHPHSLLTYRGTYANARIYAAAAFLMMAYASVPATAPPERRQEDLPIFSNTVWYLGQLLFDDVALRRATTKQQRVAILSDRLVRVLNAFAGSAAFAGFETELSDSIAVGEPLSGEKASAIYRAALERHFGGAVAIPEHRSHAWIANGLLYAGPFNAAFAEAMTTALALQNRIREGDRAALEAVRDGVGRSETHFSSDVLKAAGVDLSDPATYHSAIAQITAIASDLEAALEP
jgi:oligoendopeptidase F